MWSWPKVAITFIEERRARLAENGVARRSFNPGRLTGIFLGFETVESGAGLPQSMRATIFLC
jgi:hypothetical protein